MFLVGGTCIGGGMLALPVATGISGLLPSILVMAICWMAMTASALFLLEVNLWMRKEGAHIITMTSTILGPVGKIISWCLFLFISYASIVAYTSAGGLLISNISNAFFGMELSQAWNCAIFILTFGGVIYLGTQTVGRVNTILFIAMIAAYVGLVATGLFEVKSELFVHKKWITSIFAVPLLLTSFSFQTMLPSLTPYLNRNVTALRWAIIGGTGIAFLVYLLWLWMVLGIVPVDGPNSLIEALEAGEPITQFLREHVKSDWVSYLAEYFAFFALVTSFLGMALGLFDFLSDGLKIKKTGIGHVILGLLIVVPTYIFAVYFDRVFLVALDTSGGFGDSILNGMIPVLMVWIGRYYLRFPEENRTPGGKPLLIIVFLFFVGAFILELLVQTGSVCSIFDYCKDFHKGI
ncbi:MAG: amino acid transporter [Parachlamydiaceae bacterium]|nr:amino acid transporter [Parachlamydiaceae bacterium]